MVDKNVNNPKASGSKAKKTEKKSEYTTENNKERIKTTAFFKNQLIVTSITKKTNKQTNKKQIKSYILSCKHIQQFFFPTTHPLFSFFLF